MYDLDDSLNIDISKKNEAYLYIGIFLIFFNISPFLFSYNEISLLLIFLSVINGITSFLLVFYEHLLQTINNKILQKIIAYGIGIGFIFTPVCHLFDKTFVKLGFMQLCLSLLCLENFFSWKYLTKILIINSSAAVLVSYFVVCVKIDFYELSDAAYLIGFVLLILTTLNRQRFIYNEKEKKILLLKNKNSELEIKQLKLEKEHAVMQERYEIARSVSHDIMTPAVMLKMILRKELGNVTDEEKELLGDALMNLTGIVDSILPGVRTRYENLDEAKLNDVVKKCVAAKQFMHKRIKMQIVEEEEVYAKVDALMLARVVSNVINNSVEAMTKIVESKLVIKVCYDKFGNAKIEITDNGKGIPKDNIEKIAVTQASFGKQHGFGIGLYESKKVVNSWNGDIVINSKINEGTTVALVFPGKGVSELTFDEHKKAVREELYDPKSANTFILLDANEDYCKSCTASAAKLSIDLRAFSSQEQFLRQVHTFDKNTCFFIEFRQSNNFDATYIAKKLHSLGYKNLIFISNFAPDVPKLQFIKRILTKDLPILN